ncbi:MAG: YmdB family metallophosphoesterase [Victivallales bacterium]|nr:YmdB family metallophosphoesterase [Victivallales bacterium]
MNLLFIGDIVGKGGRNAVKRLVPELRREFNCQFCIANAENIAGGGGANAKCLKEIYPNAVDVVTMGDHTWDQKEFQHEIEGLPFVLRPANFSFRQPGRGYGVFRNPGGGDVAVIDLAGRIFMRDGSNCPFDAADKILEDIPKNVKCRIVDFHAEATSEKAAMAYYLDGRVTAVIGTHTHVQTSDAKILPGGTAFISDAGMVGAEFSVLGRKVEDVLFKFLSGMPGRLAVKETDIRLDGVVISYDIPTGKATAIQAVSRMVPHAD